MPTVTGRGKAAEKSSTVVPSCGSCCSWISPVVVSSTATCCCRVCRSHPTNVMASVSFPLTLLAVPSVSTALKDRSHDISDRHCGPARAEGDILTRMIHGAHVIIYSTDPEADRAFFRDVLKYEAVDAGHGWLIFALPPAEVAVHPSDKNDVH